MANRDTNGRRRAAILIAVLGLTALNILAQTLVFRDTFDDGIDTDYLKPYTDGRDYMGRALRLVRGEGFTAAFRDGIRMPGYPVFLAAFAGSLERPARGVRIAQIIISAAAIPLSWLLLLSLMRSRGKALLGASVFALWVPFYYFSPVLYAETASIFLIGLLCYSLAGFDPVRRVWTSIPPAIITAALIYMKPNHVLLVPVFLIFMAYVSRRRGVPVGTRLFLAPVVVVLLLLSPWTVFISRCQNSLVPLTTHGGWNLYLGSGGYSHTTPWAAGSLATRAWEDLHLSDEEGAADAYGRYTVETRAQADRDYRKRALARWTRRPLALTAYGACKILHSFGFSFRGPRDLVVMLHFLGSMAFSVYLWKRRRWREWVLLLWMITIAVMAQAFLFLPELRFKTVLFDFPALVVCILGAGVLLESDFLPGRRGGTRGIDRVRPAAIV
ncbi:MAG TPA: hypothetical protein VMX58_10000 [Patescibacteria group bacterium]|nr:hypothetical protein [Patescibacteria group bacterium]